MGPKAKAATAPADSPQPKSKQAKVRDESPGVNSGPRPPAPPSVDGVSPQEHFRLVFGATGVVSSSGLHHLRSLVSSRYVSSTLWPSLLSSGGTSAPPDVAALFAAIVCHDAATAPAAIDDVLLAGEDASVGGPFSFLLLPSSGDASARAFSSLYDSILSLPFSNVVGTASTHSSDTANAALTTLSLTFLLQCLPLATSSNASLKPLRSALRRTFADGHLLASLPPSLREFHENVTESLQLKATSAKGHSSSGKGEVGTAEGKKGELGKKNGGGRAPATPAESFHRLVERLVSRLSSADPESDSSFVPPFLALLDRLLQTLDFRRTILPYAVGMGVEPALALSPLLAPPSPSDAASMDVVGAARAAAPPAAAPHALLASLSSSLRSSLHYPIDSVTGSQLSPLAALGASDRRLHQLQRIAYKHHPLALNALSFAGVGNLRSPKMLRKMLDEGLPDDEDLRAFADVLRIKPPRPSGDSGEWGREHILLCFECFYAPAFGILTSSDKLEPLYPTEDVLFDKHLVPSSRATKLRFGGSAETANADAATPPISQVLGAVSSMPRLTLQYLSFEDYLSRNYRLYSLASAYDVRLDVVDAVRRLKPAVDAASGGLKFMGWSRMALTSFDQPFSITKVGSPNVGEVCPSSVLGSVVLDTAAFADNIKKEWDDLREFDVVFFVTVDKNAIERSIGPEDARDGGDDPEIARRLGVTAVRGAEVLEVRDEAGELVSDPAEFGVPKRPVGTKRHFKLALDPAQYYKDVTTGGNGGAVYNSFNVLIRRRGKENNFKAVLRTVRDLLNADDAVDRSFPSWLRDVFLGFGDPAAANYKSTTMRAYAKATPGVAPPDAPLDFRDTFLDEAHVREAFEGLSVSLKKEGAAAAGGGRDGFRIAFGNDGKTAVAQRCDLAATGNRIRFTKTQVEAVRSGMSPGLTVIVGPPGTGKTDVAVQVIANLYHTYPNQRILLVTHSNAALNDLFEKIMERGDLDERHMLRLGSGEADLNVESTHDFTKRGRVNFTLARRAVLLDRVQSLSESIGVAHPSERGPNGESGYTCETAGYFHLHHVASRVRAFEAAVKDKSGEVRALFPFPMFFEGAEGGFDSLEAARAKFKLLMDMFEELEEFRPFELLRSNSQRADYLLTKQARIVAMTCTHAALARAKLIKLGFKYDTLIMEEAGQVLEVETFIPTVLQRAGEGEESRLKRICLIGDHRQLPPVITNPSFAKFGNLEQSMFTRMIKLGVPHIMLDKQGRSRAEVARLYSWRYNNLGNLGHVQALPAFNSPNAGFARTIQMVDVQDYEGRGEYTPTPHYYQNLGEAEYVVAVFQFMVLIGYPPEKISILTTYNGQKDLINDIVNSRCGPNTPLARIRPGAISTVDQYQGQQNDYVLLSLVRSKESVGHLRDVRRLVVAVSRARLGLYVFCRERLFRSCHEMANVWRGFEGGSKLALVVGEGYGAADGTSARARSVQEMTDLKHLGRVVYDLQAQIIQQQRQLEQQLP